MSKFAKIMGLATGLAFGMGAGIVMATSIGDKCGSSKTPPSHPGRWYEECNQLAADCAVIGGELCPEDQNPSGGTVGGTCKLSC